MDRDRNGFIGQINGGGEQRKFLLCLSLDLICQCEWKISSQSGERQGRENVDQMDSAV